MPNIRKMLGGVAGGVASGVRGAAGGAVDVAKLLAGAGEDAPDQTELLRQFAAQAATEVPQEPERKPFTLPELDASLSPEGQKRMAEFEAANMGQKYAPSAADYMDKSYPEKKVGKAALEEYLREYEANAPHIDYKGIMEKRIADLANVPPEQKNNPLVMFAMAMGHPEEAQELIKSYTGKTAETNAKQLDRWKDLLQIKQDAIKGAMQQAMQAGDMRTIASKKWADTLMEIEHAKTQLDNQKALAAEKGMHTANSARIRGEWALRAVQARTSALLSGVGIKSDTAQHRAALDSATRRINVRINKGQDPESAYEDVMDEMHEEFDEHTPEATPSTGGAAVPPPASGGKELNPLEAKAAERRAKAAAAAAAKK